MSRVFPALKPGMDPVLPSSYRPISVLSILAKICEKILYRQLNDFYEKSNFLYKFQYGFRPTSGTTIAAVDLVNELQVLADEGRSPAVIFLDLSAAFETVDHSILIRKYALSGIADSSLELIKSYLDSRCQFAAVGSSSSEAREVRTGTPQGSNLSTLNYLIYVNDLGELPVTGRIRTFADDTAIVYEDFSKGVIESDLAIISEYFRINKLTLNLSKSKLLVVNRPREHQRSPLVMNGAIIEDTEVVKFLGVYLGSRLTWNAHIDALCRQLTQAIGVLFKVRSFLPRKALEMIYNALIQSKILYMLPLYGSAGKTTLNRVYVLQKRALRLIHHKHPRHSTLDLFTTVAPRHLPLNALHTRSIAQLAYKMTNDLTFHNTPLSRVQGIQTTRAATSRKLVVRKSRTVQYGDACLSHIAPMIFNSLPIEIVQASSVAGFKFRLTQFLREPHLLARASYP